MSFGEMLVLGIVAIVVVGPRNLPSLLRNAGQMIGRLRRMANEIRAESGIDEILEVEGIRSEIDNFKRLASGQVSLDDPSPNVVPDREREYPRTGPDAYEAYSEDVLPYVEPAAELPPGAVEPSAAPALVAADASVPLPAEPGAAHALAGPPRVPPRPTPSVPAPPLAPPPAAVPRSSPPLPASPPASTNGAGIKS
jgi:sec-independent protein translocase protein TatB